MAERDGALVVREPYANAERFAGRFGVVVNPGPEVTLSSIIYRMRAYDSTLARQVYWNSDVVDTVGVNYTGPGPVVDIVVSEVTGNN